MIRMPVGQQQHVQTSIMPTEAKGGRQTVDHTGSDIKEEMGSNLAALGQAQHRDGGVRQRSLPQASSTGASELGEKRVIEAIYDDPVRHFLLSSIDPSVGSGCCERMLRAP